MGFWGRLMNSTRSAIRAGITSWREEHLAYVGYANNIDWSSWEARNFRYVDALHYYTNTVYTDLQTYATSKLQSMKLYGKTRPFFNPVARLVESYVAKVYGGVLDTQSLRTGSIPINTLDDDLRSNISTIWYWSRWSKQKSLLVRLGAMLGDVAINVVDDIDNQQVRMEVLHPAIFREVQFDSAGNPTYVEIVYDYPDQNKRYHTFKQVITSEYYQTYRDGNLYSYDDKPAEWANDYGFVPIVFITHKDIGREWGVNAFQPSWNKIDYLNELMTLLYREVRKSVVQVYHGKGFQSANDLKIVGQEEEIPIIKGSSDSELVPLAGSLNILDTLEVIKSQIEEIERDLPELALYNLRAMGGLTAPGVRAGWDDAIQRFTEARGNYDSGLILAQQMAIQIAALRGYNGFRKWSKDAYKNGDLMHYVDDRPIIDDVLNKEQKIRFLVDIKAPTELIYSEMGFEREDIGKIKEQESEQDNREIRKQTILKTEDISEKLNLIGNLTDSEEGDDEEIGL